MTTTAFDPGALAAEATDAILRDTLHGTHRGVVVDSRRVPESPRSSSVRPSNWPRRDAR